MALLEMTQAGAALLGDRFERLADDDAFPQSGGVLVSLARFESEKDSLFARDGELGVWLQSSESPVAIAGDLDRLALVALDFPVFSDGRSYSSARLLRERYGFKGELRAIGDVLCEQFDFMLRSGFDSLEVQSPNAIEELNRVVREVRVVYQRTADGRATAIDRRMAGE